VYPVRHRAMQEIIFPNGEVALGPESAGMPRRGLAAAGAGGKGEGWVDDGMVSHGSDTRRCAVR
jgi:hypothetical protein